MNAVSCIRNSNGDSSFWAGTRPGKMVTHGEVSFELPILYLRDDLFGLYFTAEASRVRAILPSEKMVPVTLPNGRAIVAFMAFNYIDTTIGPYGEVAVAIPVLYGRKQPPLGGVMAGLLQASYPGFGVLVMHLPVTKILARDAGRGQWGYTKFVADMHFELTPDHLECRMKEGDQSILDLRVMRRGIHLQERRPLITFSVRDGELIRTVIPQRGVMRACPRTSGPFLRLGNHPVAESIRELGLSEKPFLATYYSERAAILPAGEVVEVGVRPLEGYRGSDRTGSHTVSYTGSAG